MEVTTIANAEGGPSERQSSTELSTVMQRRDWLMSALKPP